ncbi:hypothetical protein FRB94_008954 [Tulasnella sp. JGI-2019a]|nr:hypothetical protein FRB93_003513 [Tulasnella sp. JGI-2019a]KAG9014796.1 hypothetical protein FRB94_008954 [Tulasnella sp. JGI-2019a]KAG9040040.1 hypothetical protein FRB95_004512 [Tulasnella sp. JGI-2019a]
MSSNTTGVSDTIVLYDIPGKTGSRAWSPNVWKARLVLNYKGIPYRTEWVSFPDIETTFKDIGINASTAKANGEILYTCPAIIDYTVSPAEKLTDSNVIAQYLDNKYASEEQYGPKLFPEGTVDVQLAFIDRFKAALMPLGALTLGCIPAMLNCSRGAEYYNKTRSEKHGKPLTEFYPAGSPEREQAWKGLQKGLDTLAAAYDKNEEGGGEYAFGRAITYFDIVVVAAFLSARYIPVDRDGQEVKCAWDVIKTWNGGKWQKLMEKFENHLQVL